MSENTELGTLILVPRRLTTEMRDFAVYNTNRKYDHDPVDPTIAEEVYRAAISARPIQGVADSEELLERIAQALAVASGTPLRDATGAYTWDKQARAVAVELSR